VFLSPKYHLSIRYLASFLATRVSRQTDLWTSHRPSCESTGTPLSHSVVFSAVTSGMTRETGVAGRGGRCLEVFHAACNAQCSEAARWSGSIARD
jgi:hypothetical protein